MRMREREREREREKGGGIKLGQKRIAIREAYNSNSRSKCIHVIYPEAIERPSSHKFE